MEHIRLDSKELVRCIVESYVKSRNCLYSHHNITRGTSHCISSEIEDLFAYYIATNFDNNYRVYVDQPITCNINSSKKTIRFDLLLANSKNVVINAIELKMDLGRNRDGFISYCIKRGNEVKALQGKKVSSKKGVTKACINLKISAEMKWRVVIVSDKNISKEKMENIIKNSKNLNNLEVYVLTSKTHPNVYNMKIEDAMKKIEIREEEFIRLKQNLRANI